MLKRTLSALGLAAMLASPAAALHAQTAAAPAASKCQFVLGFADLAGMLPQQVGVCADNESHNPQNGDALQHTSTGGLLVWRKADNWTAFTDGYDTWINGPNGLQERLNTDRFDWEAPAPAATPAPSVAPSPVPDAGAAGGATSVLNAAQVAFIAPFVPPAKTNPAPLSALAPAVQMACLHMADDFSKLNTGKIVALQGDDPMCPYMDYQVDPTGIAQAAFAQAGGQ